MEATGEEYYPPREEITIDFVKSLQKPTQRLLCQLRDNELIKFG